MRKIADLVVLVSFVTVKGESNLLFFFRKKGEKESRRDGEKVLADSAIFTQTKNCVLCTKVPTYVQKRLQKWI